MRFIVKLDNDLYVGDVYIHYSEVSCTMVSFEDAFVFRDIEHVKQFISLYGGKDKIEVYNIDTQKTYQLKVKDIIPVEIYALDRT